MPAVAKESMVIVPEFPAFSPAAIAELLQINRCTVHYWLENQKLPFFRDNIGERYVMRAELIFFIREYLGRTIHG